MLPGEVSEVRQLPEPPGAEPDVVAQMAEAIQGLDAPLVEQLVHLASTDARADFDRMARAHAPAPDRADQLWQAVRQVVA